MKPSQNGSAQNGHKYVLASQDEKQDASKYSPDTAKVPACQKEAKFDGDPQQGLLPLPRLGAQQAKR